MQAPCSHILSLLQELGCWSHKQLTRSPHLPCFPLGNSSSGPTGISHEENRRARTAFSEPVSHNQVLVAGRAPAAADLPAPAPGERAPAGLGVRGASSSWLFSGREELPPVKTQRAAWTGGQRDLALTAAWVPGKPGPTDPGRDCLESTSPNGPQHPPAPPRPHPCGPVQGTVGEQLVWL